MQNSDSIVDSIGGGIPASRDTLIIYDVPPEMLERYLNILENTNNQLSLSHNPIAISVGFLGALIAIAAIAAGLLIFRQGEEFKRQQRSLFKGSKRKFKKMSAALEASHQELVASRIAAIDQLNKEYTKKIAEAEQAGNLSLEVELNSIKNEVARLVKEGNLLKKIDKSTNIQTSGRLVEITCPKCGHVTRILDRKGRVRVEAMNYLDMDGKFFECPSCKEVFNIQQ